MNLPKIDVGKIGKSFGSLKKIKGKLPKITKSGDRGEKNEKPVTSNQTTERIKDYIALIKPAYRKIIKFLKKVDFARYARFGLLGLVGLYLLGAVVLAIFTYSHSDGKNLKLTRKDVWIRKISAIYPLPAATVNGKFVSIHEFYEQIGYLKNFNGQVNDSLSSEIKDENSLRKKVLSSIIDTHLVQQEAAKEKIKVSQNDIDQAYLAAADANGGEQQIEQVLSKFYGMDKNQFKELIKDQIYREKIQEKILTQYKVKHILVTDQAKADAANGRLQKGESFEAVAQSASEDSNSKANGGDLGWLSKGDLNDKIDADFAKAVYGLKKGQVSGIVKTKYGYHIIKLEDKKGSIDLSIDEWIKSLEEKAKIHKIIK